MKELLAANEKYHAEKGNRPGSNANAYLGALQALFKFFQRGADADAAKTLREAIAALDAPKRTAQAAALAEGKAKKKKTKKVTRVCTAMHPCVAWLAACARVTLIFTSIVLTFLRMWTSTST